jgi:aspartyl-tRNA(Asn)/glutamyl-tRNA(Gln) amidotransferase subunit A
MSHNLTQMTAAHLGKLYAKGKTSPVETMEAVLARTEVVNPALNAFCKVDTEEALRAARASERRWKKARRCRRSTAFLSRSRNWCA